MSKRFIFGLLLIAILIIPIAYSTVNEPNLSIGSCLVKNSAEFRLKVVGRDSEGQWRLFRVGSADFIDLGHVKNGESIGSFDKDTLKTSLEGTWVKKYWDGNAWIQKGGNHVISVAGHTSLGYFCPENEIPEFSIMALFIAILGSLGILIYSRNR